MDAHPIDVPDGQGRRRYRRRPRRLWRRAMRLLMILVFALIIGVTSSYALRTLNL